MHMTDEEKSHLRAVYNALPKNRLQPYLEECGHNPFAALTLYAWNSCMSGALFETLGHFEILLRNLLDRTLTERHGFKKRGGDWLDDRHGEFTPSASKAILGATSRAQATAAAGGLPDRGRIIAELNLSFWRRLLDVRYERIHGSAVMRQVPALKRHTNDDMANLRQLVEPLYSLRNRIAHHEPVWSLAHIARRDDCFRLIGLMDADAETWVRVQCRVGEVAAARP
ncbi:MAG: hypothetical protein JWR01_1413 [Subtercola sp.]|nr:hypothetical protein [Subtercola sp.]